MTISLALIRLIPNPKKAALLGGLLRFISYRETLDLLAHWKAEHPLLSQLYRLSEQLIDFPSIELPSTSEPIHTQLLGLLDQNYLAAQFCTRRSPGLTSNDQLKITCLRTWLLLKSLEFCSAGHQTDLSLKHLCTQLRLALDDRDNGTKRSWFLQTIEPALSLDRFENSLRLNIDKRHKTATGLDLEGIRALDALLSNKPRPDKDRKPVWLTLPQPEPDESRAERDAWDQTATEDDGHFHFMETEEEDELEVLQITVDETSTPPQSIREAKGIVFQTLEDQQYLPYTWNRLRADEAELLRESIQLRLRDTDSSHRLLAAIAAVAFCIRRSMQTIETLRLGSASSDDWQLDLDTGCLHRLPSRRQVRWQANEVAREWIRPLSAQWRITLHPNVAVILADAGRANPQALTISGLWTDKDLTLESAFNRWCRQVPGLARISSGLLVRQPEQAAFEHTLDHSFARLLTSPSRAGIPGSGAYPSWTGQQVAATTNIIASGVGTMYVEAPTHNALGSELDPDDFLLGEALGRIKNKLDSLAHTEDWIAYHNHLTAYGVLFLLAATGARPVTSVFESITQFDLDNCRVYLEDKVSRSSADGTAGRLVPLPDKVAAFLRDTYLPYLTHLAHGLSTWLPNISAEITAHIDGRGSAKLPLFFLLRREPDFDWIEISETSLRALFLIDWPLPLNLFRHRLATRLRSEGLDPEVIDAQLGHAESGSETYSDYSPRCWLNDKKAWGAALDRCLSALKVEDHKLSRLPITRVPTAPGYQEFSNGDFFGRNARQQNREERKASARRKARSEIDLFVGNRPIDSISPTEWEQLGRSMLLTEHNLRQPNASTRYQVFEDFLKQEWREQGKRPRLRKWLAILPKPQSVFTPRVIGVSERLSKLREVLDRVVTDLPWPVSIGVASTVAALDLCLFGRVTCPKALEALATADRTRVRMVIWEQRAYLEFSEWFGQVDAPPVKRYLLPSRSARYVDLALSTKKSPATSDASQQVILALAKSAGITADREPSVHHLLSHLAQEVGQENAVLLPGIVAGVLAGRVQSAAAPWSDWMRTRAGEPRVAPQSEETTPRVPTSAQKTEPIVSPRAPIGILNSRDKERSRSACLAFLGQIRSVLNDYLASKSHSNVPGASSKNTRTNTDTAARRNARTRIERALEKPDGAVSLTVFALGAWVLHLLYRPYRHSLLDAASVKRYMDSLSHGFVSFGSELDLADLDGEELTEFYRCVLEGSDESADDESNDPEAEASSKHPPKKRGQKYVLQRLEEFHRFAVERFGLDSPDWGEISDGLVSGLSNPGTVTETEYLEALSSLCPDPLTGTTASVRDAYVLLLAYRFGLRGGEAIRLRPRDWIEISGAVVVLVDGRHRQLKTRSSQRQVPLVEKLTELELAVIRRWQAHWTTESGNDDSVPMFFDEHQRHHVAEIRPIRTRLLDALRKATNHSSTTLHHARHSFANRAFEYLILPKNSKIWTYQQKQEESTADSALRAILTTATPTRRAPWAIARLLGHATPSTSFCSYLHIQYDWTARSIAEADEARFTDVKLRAHKSATNLDDWIAEPRTARIISIIEAESFNRCTPSLVLKYCRLRAQGYPARTAREKCRIAYNDWSNIEQSLTTTGAKLAPQNVKVDSTISGITLPLAILGKIHPSRWQSLIEVATALEEKQDLPKNQFHEAPAQQIGKTRQLLLWTQSHFEQLRQYLDWTGTSNEHIDIFRPNRLDGQVETWAKRVGLFNLKATRTADGKKVFQVDTAIEDRHGTTVVIHPDRVAVTTNALNCITRDNYEFILLWLVFSVTQLSLNSSAPSIRRNDINS